MSKNNKIIVSEITEVNGKGILFTEGKDFVVIEGEKYFTKEAIAIKYGIAESTVNNKVRDHNIKKSNVLGNTLFHDDPKFSPKPRTYAKGTFGNGQDEKRFKQMSYNNLVSEVQKQKEIINNSVTAINVLIRQMNDIEKYIKQIGHHIQDNATKLDMLLDHLTKDKNSPDMIKINDPQKD